jgi:predicted ester cyclase
MSLQDDNKTVVGRWFTEYWGNPWKPEVVDELAAPDIRFEYSLHQPLRGRDAVRRFGESFRAAFPDLNFWGTADLIAEGDYVVGQWEGGGTHTGIAFGELPIGSLPAGSGKTMRFTGVTVLRVQNGLITEEIGLDDGVKVLQQLGIVPSA